MPDKVVGGRSEATRRRLSEVALELFALKGYEATTTAEIAAAANVTERTFFNHFDTKLDAVFLRDEYTSFVSLRNAVAAVGPESDALPSAYRCGVAWMDAELSQDPERHHRTGRLRVQISEGSPAVRGMRQSSLNELVSALAHGLADRGGRELPARSDDVAGLVAGSLLTHAYGQWLAQDEMAAFESIAESLLDELHLLAATGVVSS